MEADNFPQTYPHIEMARVQSEPERRPRQGFRRPPPFEGTRREHGEQIGTATAEALQAVQSARRSQGIMPDALLVLAFHSVNVDLREYLERFGAWIVEERQDRVKKEDQVEKQELYYYTVQFPDLDAVQAFQHELELYRQEEQRRSVLPRGQRQELFDNLQQVRSLSREDRLGTRLRGEGFPDNEPFYFDVDIWHPGDRERAITLRNELRAWCREHAGELREDFNTSSLILLKVYGTRVLAELFLENDLVARVDLPPRIELVNTRIFDPMDPPSPATLPPDDAPLACVIDSGVVSGHPWLRNWVIDERDFGTGENTPVDIDGHGTSVAGLVVYGDIARCLENNDWQPKVRLCSAKVLRRNPDWPENGPQFPDEHRIEGIIEEAIKYFHREHRCRIFNLSIGSFTDIYQGGRQFPWAEKLDELARDLDIVIVVSAGNRPDPPIPDNVYTRESFQQAVRDQLTSDEQKLCNPATAALAVTVGSIARNDGLGNPTDRRRLQDAIAAAPRNAPSPFTRTGPGYKVTSNAMVKPDFVHYGGNYALQSAGGQSKWSTHHYVLGEPTIQKEENGRYIGARVGTSFATPHVTHAAAVALATLQQHLQGSPSANLVRALVASTARTPLEAPDWLGSEKNTLDLIGYGLCSEEEVVASYNHRVRLVAEDSIEEDKVHIYRIPVPEAFLRSGRAQRGITVALAYDPPVRGSRKEYIARTLSFHVCCGLNTAEVEQYWAKGADRSQLPKPQEIELRPTNQTVQWSTLQVRHRTWSQKPQLRTEDNEESPVIHLIVECQKRFLTGLDPQQRYGLTVLFWHESQEVELYQNLRASVSVPVRVRVES